MPCPVLWQMSMLMLQGLRTVVPSQSSRTLTVVDHYNLGLNMAMTLWLVSMGQVCRTQGRIKTS